MNRLSKNKEQLHALQDEQEKVAQRIAKVEELLQRLAKINPALDPHQQITNIPMFRAEPTTDLFETYRSAIAEDWHYDVQQDNPRCPRHKHIPSEQRFAKMNFAPELSKLNEEWEAFQGEDAKPLKVGKKYKEPVPNFNARYYSDHNEQFLSEDESDPRPRVTMEDIDHLLKKQARSRRSTKGGERLRDDHTINLITIDGEKFLKVDDHLLSANEVATAVAYFLESGDELISKSHR